MKAWWGRVRQCWYFKVIGSLILAFEAYRQVVETLALNVIGDSRTAVSNLQHFLIILPIVPEGAMRTLLVVIGVAMLAVSCWPKRSLSAPTEFKEPVTLTEPASAQALVVAAPINEQPAYWLDFKSKTQSGKNAKWKPGDPNGEAIKEIVRSNVPESPHKKALWIDTGTNSLVHDMAYCHKVKQIEFFLCPLRAAEQYIRLRLTDPKGKSRSIYHLHIHCTMGAMPPEPGHMTDSSMEWDVCVDVDWIEHRGWMRFVVDVHDLFSQTFGTEGYRLEGVDGIHLRGRMEIAAIRMYGPKCKHRT